MRGVIVLLLASSVASAAVDDRCPVVAQRPSPKPRKLHLRLALGKDWRSDMLRRELERDWTRANPALILTARQKSELASAAQAMGHMQRLVRERFTIEFVDGFQIPTSDLPAAQIGRGPWQTIDRRAFTIETRPLETLDWWRRLYLFDTASGAENTWSTMEGYSGAESDPVAPWEPKPPEPVPVAAACPDRAERDVP
jgi:hypothetical protein